MCSIQNFTVPFYLSVKDVLLCLHVSVRTIGGVELPVAAPNTHTQLFVLPYLNNCS